MAFKIFNLIRARFFSAASDTAMEIGPVGEDQPRFTLDAGGKLSWGAGGPTAVDTNLYRDSANTLKTDDTFKVPALYVDSIEVDTTGASNGHSLVFNGTKFTPAFAINSAHESVHAATNAILPNSPAYTAGSADSNGGYGVGAYLQATSFGALTVDSHSLNANERVLVKDQLNAIHNGIYTVTTVGSDSTYWRLTRALDFDNSTGAEASHGDFVFVSQGTANSGTSWLMTTYGTGTNESIIIGADEMYWVNVGGVGPQGPQGPQGVGGTIAYYGSFYSTSDQTATTGGEAVRFDSINVNNGITVVTNGTYLTRITIPATGTYIIDFAGQLSTTGGATQANFWLVKNGTTAVSTAFDSSASGVDPTLTNWAWQVDATANDYYEIFWNSNSLLLQEHLSVFPK